MHYNTLFQDRNLNNFLGRGTARPQTTPHWSGEWAQTPSHPLGASIVAPSALHTSRFCSVLCVPYFQCRLLATLTVTNVLQGKRSQRWKFTGPPIKNPGYANDWLPLKMRTQSLRMRRITWPVSRGWKMITFLQSATPICLFTIQLRWLYDEYN